MIDVAVDAGEGPLPQKKRRGNKAPPMSVEEFKGVVAKYGTWRRAKEAGAVLCGYSTFQKYLNTLKLLRDNAALSKYQADPRILSGHCTNEALSGFLQAGVFSRSFC